MLVAPVGIKSANGSILFTSILILIVFLPASSIRSVESPTVKYLKVPFPKDSEQLGDTMVLT
ncbi:hypothetical protein DRO42_00085 [Candidatus Bathyarchaeota archaeon]|nr:MAG: hypothetical protein DRO42_00085 [Candidatus Bathyarchaeota archaeon]